MSEKNCADAGERGLAHRPGASRKLLSLKAREKRPLSMAEPPLESSFPSESPASLADPSPSNLPRHRGPLAQKTLRLGGIQPNPGTVFATIVGIVAVSGELSRTELINTMRRSSFPHPAARPQDSGWCQGYVAGAVRNGFLAIVVRPNADASSEPSIYSAEAA